MKVLHIIQSLQIGGAEKLMVDLLPRLRKEGNEVELLVFDGICTPFYEELEKKGIMIHHLHIGGNVYNPLNIFRLMRYIRGYDVIHTHNTAAQLFLAICSILNKTSLVTTEHSTSNRRRSWKWYKWIDRWMYNRYSHIICISDKAYDNFCRYIGHVKSKVMTIYNGVDVNLYINAIPNVSFKEQYKNCVTAIMVGRFCYQKDQKTVIRACQYLPSNYHILFAGVGEEQNECKILVQKMNLENRVHFLGNRTDIPSLLKSVDIVVLSSHLEGLSLSSIEGMASGNPFIASDVDGLREIVKGYGILFSHGNSQELAEKMIKVVDDELYRKKIIEQCRNRAMEYDISVMVSKYNDVYKSIILR